MTPEQTAAQTALDEAKAELAAARAAYEVGPRDMLAMGRLARAVQSQQAAEAAHEAAMTEGLAAQIDGLGNE